MIHKTNCSHDWQEINNRLVCSKCSTSKLKKIKIDDDLSYGIKDNGMKYKIRSDRNRYFFPQEWKLFYNSLKEKNKLVFDFLIKTGARIEEALHFKKVGLIDDERKSIKLFVTKKKHNKIGEEDGKPRSFEIDTTLYNKLNQINKPYIFLDVDNNISREDSKKLAGKKAVAMRELMKRKLKKIGIKDYYNFGLHNIRKTHGMYLKALDIPQTEICLRLGHDINTYISNYGSPSVFQPKDKQDMIKILGDIYGLK